MTPDVLEFEIASALKEAYLKGISAGTKYGPLAISQDPGTVEERNRIMDAVCDYIEAALVAGT